MSSFGPGRRIWTKDTILAAILAESYRGQELSYRATEQRAPALVRAAERLFGSWGTAVNAAGFDYDTIRRYRRWSREKIIERIRELHAKGEDLSWRNVSMRLDPPLAAAALHKRFACWADALKAAGLSPDEICRYRAWKSADLYEELLTLHAKGVPLTRKTLAAADGALLAALYRRGKGLVAARDVAMRRFTDE
ncbi:MAG: hypothetical protein ACYC7E_21945 [Armatimonadota bacterium]